MNILDKLLQKNEYPIVFIGSGIPKRFLINFPNWPQLLEELWLESGLTNFYGELNNLHTEIKREFPDYNDREVEHAAYIRTGSLLETEYNRRFNEGLITIKNFSQRDAFLNKLSPLKKAISERFNNYSLCNEKSEEYEYFIKMLMKTQIILTTNYDSFIEDSYNSSGINEITKFIGQRGFFQESFNFAELYKVHGCIYSPEEIILTKSDYERFEKNSVLITAKIVSIMLTSPIIFLGYSLTDVNMRKIIRDFINSLGDSEIAMLEERLILIEWKEGEQELIEEIMYDRDLGCNLKLIKTDNYKMVFDAISKIDQGVAPSEVRKYQHVIKKLIVDSGKKGCLHTLLIAPNQLEEIEKRIGDGKLIVAIGDATYIFQMPDLLGYINNYFFEPELIHTDIALRFIASQISSSRIPFLKYVKDVDIDKTNLHQFDKDKLKQRISNYTNLEDCTKSINASYKIRLDSLSDIRQQNFNKEKEFEVVSYSAQRISLSELEDYVREHLDYYQEKKARSLPTAFRRLLMVMDMIKNKG
ncbi:hypothetical protein HGI30_19745 [Paenibacillus albicereus]|uniref:Uncharacterized protein n=1 Tax=Paenibacillus albicereus TaxID=2726185 RepID=A0A6H2H1L7_9BACL|nr:SIR2 family protein [Paenibacillus albicereus]QJC53547.1 hypothetical protein HGI30_19745 [Paenibacillus albicereus]